MTCYLLVSVEFNHKFSKVITYICKLKGVINKKNVHNNVRNSFVYLKK